MSLRESLICAFLEHFFFAEKITIKILNKIHSNKLLIKMYKTL